MAQVFRLLAAYPVPVISKVVDTLAQIIGSVLALALQRSDRHVSSDSVESD